MQPVPPKWLRKATPSSLEISCFIPSVFFLRSRRAWSSDHATVSGPERRPYRLLVDLAHSRQRKLRDKGHFFRRVQASLALFDERDEFGFANVAIRLADNERENTFAPFSVGHAYHGSHADTRMAGQDILDLTWVDVEAARDDHVLLAVNDIETALSIGTRDVAGVQPTTRERRLGLLRLMPVVTHDHRPAHANFTRLAGRNILIVVVKKPDRTGRGREAARLEQFWPRPIVIALAQHGNRITFGLAI